MTYAILSVSSSTNGSQTETNVANNPFLIISKFVHPDDYGGIIKLQSSGALLALWQSGEISYIRREADLGDRFRSGVFSPAEIRRIRVKVERAFEAKQINSGIELHGSHNRIQYQYSNEKRYRETLGESPRNGHTQIEKILDFIRSLPIKRSIERNGFILPKQDLN